MNLLKKHFRLILLFTILLVALFLRLYRISETQTFLEDEGRDMLIVKRQLDTGRPVLIGPQTSTGSMYLGPLYYYFITPALILSGMDPVGPAILIAFTGVLTCYLLYKIFAKWSGQLSGFFAATLYAVMPLPVSFTRNSWNPNLAPLISLITLYILDKLKDRTGNLKWFFWLGISAGVLIQLHYMTLIYLAVIAILIFYWWVFPFNKKHFLKFGKGIFLGMAGFFLTLFPFFVFEIRNDWVNTNAISRFIVAKEERNIRYDLPVWLWEKKVVGTTADIFGGLFTRQEFVHSDNLSLYLIVAGLACVVLAILFSSLNKHRKQMIFFLLFGSLGAIGIYQENIHIHYLGFLFPLVYLAFASALSTKYIWVKATALIFGGFVLLYSFPTTVLKIGSGATHQKDKAEAVAAYISAHSEGQPYNIASDEFTSTSPYQYYTYLLDNPPTSDHALNTFLICEGSPCREESIKNRRIFVTGPAHPTLGNYVGHPLATYVVEEPVVVSNDHVKLGVWVAHLRLVKPE